MTAPLPGHTASNLSRVATPPLLKVDNLSLEYRTAQRVVRATHQVSFEVDRACDRLRVVCRTLLRFCCHKHHHISRCHGRIQCVDTGMKPAGVGRHF